MGNSNKKKIILGLTLLLIFAPFTSVLAEEHTEEQDNYDQQKLEQFEEIYWYIKDYHLESPDTDQLIDLAILGMILSLDDPYTTYFTDEEFEDFLNEIDGTLVGVGIQVGMMSGDGGVYVIDVIEGGPAEAAGVQVGDIITHVDGEVLEFTYFDEVVNKIRGEEGSEISLTIQRTENSEFVSHTFEMNRQVIELPLVETDILDDRIGVLKLNSFGYDMVDEVEEALISLQAEAVEGLIIDLRGNPGGYVGTVFTIASMLKDSGEVLHVRDSTNQLETYEIEEGKNLNLPLVVLVDEGSASGSEVLAGFIQDHELGTVMGQQTFGKGTVQSLIALETGGALKLTVEEYYTPHRHQVNGKGITPDILVEERNFQLAKAYGYLVEKNAIVIAEENILWNGIIPEEKFLYVLEKDGQSYIELRTLAKWFDGSLSWDPQTQSIIVSIGDETYDIQQNHEAIQVDNGTSYVNIEQVMNFLPIQVEQTDEGVVISR